MALDGFWFEVRPLTDLKTKDFQSILNMLHGFNEPFSFFLTSQPSTILEERVVKIFFRVLDLNLQDYLAQTVKNVLGVEIVKGEKPKKMVYGCCFETEMTKHYSHPLVTEDVKGLVDRIYEAVWHTNGALEVTCQPDQGAKTWIYNEIEKVMGKGVKARDLLPFTTKKSVEERVKVAKEDPYKKTLMELMMKKYRSKLFKCTIKIYAQTRNDAETILKAIPTNLNRLRKFKTKKNIVFPEPFKKPSRHTLRNFCNKISFLTPMLTLYLCWFFGIFNLHKLTLEGIKLKLILDLNMLPVLLATLSLMVPLTILRKRNAVVLSTEELLAIIGIPEAINRIPLEHVETPIV